MAKPDTEDILALLGLLLIGGGIWIQAPWLAMVVDGSLLFLVSLVAILKR